MIKKCFSLLLFLIGFSVTVFAETIVIGIDADMSSNSAIGGEAIYRGAKIAVDEINEKGGVLGKPLVLKVKDHRGNPRRGIDNIKDFAKEENIVAILGGVQSPVAVNELTAIHENQLIYLGPWAAATTLVDNGYTPNYVFRLSVRDQYAAEVLIRKAKSRGLKKIGILLPRTTWGRSNHQSLVAAAKEHGIKITKIVWFNWSNQYFSRKYEQLIDAKSDAVIFVGTATEGVGLVDALWALPENERLPVISHWGLASGKFVGIVGKERLAAVDLSVLQTFSFAKPNNIEKANYVFAKYQEKFAPTITKESIPAVTGVAHAYDLIHLLAIAIENSQSTDRSIIRNALENIVSYDGLLGVFEQPFSPAKHDALNTTNYIFTQYNSEGYLVPIDSSNVIH